MKQLIFLAGLALALPAAGRVLDLHTEIRIAKSGEVTVIERITLEASEKANALMRNAHPEGRNRHQVTYQAARRIAFRRDHDALHWELKGAEHVSAEVILPAAVPARQIKVEAAGGEFQSFVRDGRAAFRALQPIKVVVRFPKGIVTEPSLGERVRWFFSDYPGVLLVIAMLGLSALVLTAIRGQGAKS